MKNIAATIAAAGSAIIILGAAMMPTTVSAAQIGTLSSDINGFCVDDMQSYSCYDDGCYTDSYHYIDDDYYMRGYHYDEDDCVTAATGDAYPGTYVCGRAVINIERDNQFYDVNITWSNTAAEHTEWSYVCYYDQGSGSLIAIDNGSKETVGFNEKGRVEYSYTEYTDGSAQFMLDGDELYWEDLEEAAGSGMVFEQV